MPTSAGRTISSKILTENSGGDDRGEKEHQGGYISDEHEFRENFIDRISQKKAGFVPAESCEPLNYLIFVGGPEILMIDLIACGVKTFPDPA